VTFLRLDLIDLFCRHWYIFMIPLSWNKIN